MQAPSASSSPVATQARAEAKAQLLLRLRARGFRDLTLLRALESAPRENFIDPAFADLALRDAAAPLPCGQTLESPSTLAQMLAALGPQPHHRVLEIGTGSSYSAAVLSRLCREVVSVERVERLALEARARIEALRIDTVEILWADGFDVSPSFGLFDRILAHGAFDEPPPLLLAALDEGGVMVCARRRDGGQPELMRHSRAPGGRFLSASCGPCRAQPLKTGLVAWIQG